MDLSTLTALTWVALIASALFALVLPAKESTGVMLALLLMGDAIALWAYRRDANTAVLGASCRQCSSACASERPFGR